MIVPDITELIHAAQPYDAAKAHEYYLRTRHLKGRVGGVQLDRKGSGPSSGHPRAKPHNSSAHAAAEARKDALVARLSHLREVLAQLVQAAQKRSGIETHSTNDTTTKKSADSKTGGGDKKSSSSEKLTAAQKAEKNKKAREDYKKENKNNTTTSQDIKELEAKIRDIRQQIKDAIAEARQHPKSKTAAKGR